MNNPYNRQKAMGNQYYFSYMDDDGKDSKDMPQENQSRGIEVAEERQNYH